MIYNATDRSADRHSLDDAAGVYPRGHQRLSQLDLGGSDMMKSRSGASAFGATSSVRPRSRAKCSMARSATAVMVNSGWTPNEQGITEPSQT